MTSAIAIRDAVANFLDTEVEADEQGGRIALLTPVEYPDGDSVVVWVSERDEGGFDVSDLGEADARLIGAGPGARAIGPPALSIARRMGATFDEGVVSSRAATLADVPATCWRVAQAASAIAEALTYHREQAPKEAAFVDLVEVSIKRLNVDVQVEPEIRGASGHSYRPTLFLPSQDAIIEPISGEKIWNKASAVYVQFGDLSAVNGYKLLAVLDDRDSAQGQEVEGLLGQVALVSRWSQRSRWLETLSRGRLL